VTSNLRVEVVTWPFPACAMHPATIKETVRSIVDLAMGQIPHYAECISSFINI